MHRILLYSLVVALFLLAFDARRRSAISAAQADAVAGQGDGFWGGRQGDPAMGGDDRSGGGRPRAAGSTAYPEDSTLQARLHRARMDLAEDAGWNGYGPFSAAAGRDREASSRGPGGAMGDRGAPDGRDSAADADDPERVLAAAEAWIESNFPETGATQPAELPRRGTRNETQPPGEEPAAPGESRPWWSEPGGGAGEAPTTRDPAPTVYVASLARIEAIDGGGIGDAGGGTNSGAWTGVLDLALRPTRSEHEARQQLARGDEAWVQTAWLGDESGNVLARVEALDGLGLMLDPSWPWWRVRPSRLASTQGGIAGLQGMRYRLVLEGSTPGTTWSGVLLLLPTRPRRAR